MTPLRGPAGALEHEADVREEFFGGRTRTCTAGAVRHPPEEVHRDDFGNRGTRIFTIEFDGEWLERIATRLDEPAETRGGEIVPLMRRACSELTRIDELSPLVCEGLALEILAERSRHARSRHARPPGWLARTRDAVASRFRVKRMVMADVDEPAPPHN